MYIVQFWTQRRQSARLSLQSSKLGPHPLTRRRVRPPLWLRGEHIRLRERGRAAPIRTRGQTLWYSRYICTSWCRTSLYFNIKKLIANIRIGNLYLWEDNINKKRNYRAYYFAPLTQLKFTTKNNTMTEQNLQSVKIKCAMRKKIRAAQYSLRRHFALLICSLLKLFGV